MLVHTVLNKQDICCIINGRRDGEKTIIRNLVWDDFTIQAKVKVVEGDRDAGLIFRVHHPSIGYDMFKGYFAGLILGADKAVLGKIDGENWHELALVDLPCQENAWYDLKVTANKDLSEFVLLMFMLNLTKYQLLILKVSPMKSRKSR